MKNRRKKYLSIIDELYCLGDNIEYGLFLSTCYCEKCNHKTRRDSYKSSLKARLKHRKLRRKYGKTPVGKMRGYLMNIWWEI